MTIIMNIVSVMKIYYTYFPPSHSFSIFCFLLEGWIIVKCSDMHFIASAVLFMDSLKLPKIFNIRSSCSISRVIRRPAFEVAKVLIWSLSRDGSSSIYEEFRESCIHVGIDSSPFDPCEHMPFFSRANSVGNGIGNWFRNTFFLKLDLNSGGINFSVHSTKFSKFQVRSN